MRDSPYTNDEMRNARFLRGFLARHQGDLRAARLEIRLLGDAHESGRPWWAFMEAQVTVLIVESLTAVGLARRLGRIVSHEERKAA